MSSFHKPVLLNEVLEFLFVRKGELYIDGTLGGGGHTKGVIEKGGRVLGIDVDQEALDYVGSELESDIDNSQLALARGNFKDIDQIAHLNSFDKVAGIIFDLGVSNYQIDTPGRGFSYLRNGPLDMRMDKDLGVSAGDLVNILTKGELNELFRKLGEEFNARVISERIVSARRVKKIETIDDLIQAVYGLNRTISPFERAKRFKKIFQALRIAVNDELNNLKEALPKAISLLKKDGRLAIITFHSLEDRIVKQAFQEYMEDGIGTILTKKPIIPSDSEIEENSRSKSAKLRVLKKI